MSVQSQPDLFNEEPVDPFGRWQAGLMYRTEAALALGGELVEVEDVYRRAETERKRLRALLSEIVAADEEPITVPGLGVLRITSATLVERWDGIQLRALAAQLVADGHGAVADLILACCVPTGRAGGLRIDPLSKGKGHDNHTTHHEGISG